MISQTQSVPPILTGLTASAVNRSKSVSTDYSSTRTECTLVHKHPKMDYSKTPFSRPSNSLDDAFDFFGQFVKNPVIRSLHSAARARFFDCRPLSCPECAIMLPLNPTSDAYLHCAGCGTYWDLLVHRPVLTKTDQIPQMVLPL